MKVHFRRYDNPLAPMCGASDGRIVSDITHVDCPLCMVRGIETLTLDERKALLATLEKQNAC